MNAAPRRALFLDRDGVINEDTGYLHEAAKCRFVDGIFEFARGFAVAGFTIVIVTNQAGIGRGYYTDKDFQTFMRWMLEQFASRGVTIEAFYYCPDHPTEGLGSYRRDTPRRKPGPGMFLEAARDLDLDLRQSWSVGDKLTDIEAARAAGIGTLVKYEPLAGGVAKCQDFWIVPRLSAISDLLAEERG